MCIAVRTASYILSVNTVGGSAVRHYLMHLSLLSLTSSSSSPSSFSMSLSVQRLREMRFRQYLACLNQCSATETSDWSQRSAMLRTLRVVVNKHPRRINALRCLELHKMLSQNWLRTSLHYLAKSEYLGLAVRFYTVTPQLFNLTVQCKIVYSRGLRCHILDHRFMKKIKLHNNTKH